MVDIHDHWSRLRALQMRLRLRSQRTPSCSAACSDRGFTMLELMIAIAIVGILSALAAPALMTMVATQRIKSATFDLYAAVTYARSEAIKRNTAVTITPTAGDFAKGYTLAAGAVVLRTNVGSPAVTIVSVPPPTVALAFDGFGRLTSAASPLELTPASSSVPRRCLVLSPSGRASIRVGTC
jgi:type IV fimbrial biogenesis protein FimT